MRGVRAVSAGGTVLLGVLLASVVPAGAAPVHPGSVHGAHAGRARAAVASPLAGLTALARAGAAGPGGAALAMRFAHTGPPRPVGPAVADALNDKLNGNSCTPLDNGSAATATCLAAGTFQDSATVQPLALTWQQGGPWAGLGTVPDANTKNRVNLPGEVSCAAPGKLRPVCLMTGEHYANSRFPAQLAEVWDGTWTKLSTGNPPGTSWSALEDVSCRTDKFCMLTGQAGTTKQTSHGTVFISHATAYRWDGTKLTRLTVPAPRGGHDAELAGVSCPATTFCLAVGNYIRADGKSQAYSARWSGGTWTVQNARNLQGQVLTLFEAVSCVSRTRCEAVGTTLTPGNRAFAEAWSSGTWQTQPSAGKANATLFGVTCPAAGRCFAAGSLGDLALIEAWDGTRWSAQTTPVTAAPRSGSALNHVSCTTPDLCEAVGYRFSRSRSDVTPHTLALGWDGQHWTVQPTVNQ
jgi:hypothetical protein